MTKTYQMGSGLPVEDQAPETTEINDGADNAVIDEALKPAFEYFNAKKYIVEANSDEVAVYTLQDADGEDLAIGTVIELTEFVNQDVLGKNSSDGE